MAIEDQIANLKRTGALKDAVRDKDAIRQYLSNARQYRDDASRAASALGQFTLAYEALHALAMAVLTDRGVRTGGEGHRSIALQLSIVELTKDTIKGAAQAMGRIHGARNDSTNFKPIPPVSKALAKVTLKLLDAALAGAEATIKLEDPEASRVAGNESADDRGGRAPPAAQQIDAECELIGALPLSACSEELSKTPNSPRSPGSSPRGCP